LTNYDPRRFLGARDPVIDEMKRSSVPSSFKVCSSGPSCRSQDRLTLSIARNRLCAQCLKRYCAKCMEETVLLEGRWSSASAVCFSCGGELEQERQMLLQLQRNDKFSDPPAESSEDMACRHLLRLSASLAYAARLFCHYPFVRVSGEDCRANLMFVAQDHVPFDFFWKCSGPTELLIHLPFVSTVKSVVFLAPPSGWSDNKNNNNNNNNNNNSNNNSNNNAPIAVSLSWAESGQRIVAGSLQSELKCKLLPEEGGSCHNVVRLEFGGRVRVARVVLELEEARTAGSKLVVSNNDARHNSFEIFGKKSTDSKLPSVATSKISTTLVQDMLPSSQVLVDPFKKELRSSNTTDFWLVKQRNSVPFAGGFALRLAREELPQQISVRVHSFQVDEKGDYKSSQLLGHFVVGSVSTVSIVWFALPLLHSASCISVEVLCAAPTQQQLWLTKHRTVNV
jgi:hypothetical protein